MSKTTTQTDESIGKKSTYSTDLRMTYAVLFFFLSFTLISAVIFYNRGFNPENALKFSPILILLVGWYIGRPVVSGLVHTRKTENDELTEYPSVTVQLPAYNEENNIEDAVKSIHEQEYQGNVEIIVVDDGSTDETWNILQSLMDKYGELKAFTKANEGIAPTRNYALEKGTGEIVITMDSDTILEQGAIISLVSNFKEKDTVAVASNVETRNDEDNWWTRSQSIEYLVSMEMARMFQSKFRHLMVVSGGCGAYRRSVLEEIGGWNEVGHRYAEDFDLTIQAHEFGNIAFTADAIALTECPDTLRGWWTQRIQWAGRGLRTILHHRNAVFNPNFSLLGLFALPLKLFLSAVLLWTVGTTLLDILSIGTINGVLSTIGTVYVLGLIVTSGLSLLLLGIVSTYVNHFSPLQKLTTLPVYLTIYRQLHVSVRVVAFTYVLSQLAWEIVTNRIGENRPKD